MGDANSMGEPTPVRESFTSMGDTTSMADNEWTKVDEDRVCTVCVALLGQYGKIEDMINSYCGIDGCSVEGMGSDELTFTGFSLLIDSVEVQCSETDKRAIFQMIDKNGSGSISASELKALLRSSGAIDRMYTDSLQTVAILVGATLAFDAGIYALRGMPDAIDFLTAYVLEDSLSVDNLFVFLLIFRYFKVPPQLVDTCLNYGISGAIALRGVFIFTGLAAVSAFSPILLGFSAFLLFSSYQLLQEGGPSSDANGKANGEEGLALPPVVENVLNKLPLSRSFEGTRFTVETPSGPQLTQLTATLVSIALCDVLFAVDSIPAVLAVSSDPFIVYSSNIAAVVGLRSLYQILSVAVADLVYLEKAVAFVLGFVGLKLGIQVLGYEINSGISLAVILATLGGGVIVSFFAEQVNEEINQPLDCERPVMFVVEDEDSTKFNFARWVLHSSQERYLLVLGGTFFGITTRRIAPSALFLACSSALSVMYCQAAAADPNLIPIQLPLFAFELSVPLLGLLLVFRSDNAYSRFNDGSTYAWDITNSLRSYIRRIVAWTSSTRSTAAERAAADEIVAACCLLHQWVMNEFLRPPSTSDSHYEAHGSHVYDDLLRQALGVNAAAVTASATTAGGGPRGDSGGGPTPYLGLEAIALGATQRLPALTDQERVGLEDMLAVTAERLGQCERILRQPIPLGYKRYTIRFLWVWLLLLPFALVPNWTAASPALIVFTVTFLGVIFLSIEDIAVQIENPFMILPLDLTHRWLLRDVERSRQLLAWSSQQRAEQAHFSAGMHRNALARDAADANRDGVLDLDEFCRLVRFREEGEFTDEELRFRFDALDVDGDGLICMSEYLLWSLKDALARSEQRVMDLFRAWDENRSGSVDRLEFHRAMRSLGFDASHADTDAVFDYLDDDRSGLLEYDELNRMLRTGAGSEAVKADLRRTRDPYSGPLGPG